MAMPQPRVLLVVLGVGLVAACARSGSERSATTAPRYFRDGVLVSTCRPMLRLSADPGFRYLSAHSFRIRNVAGGERHVFVDTEGRRVRRLLLLQFEGYLDGVEGSYRYGITNPVVLGGETYSQNVYLFSSQGDLAPEGIATRTFLEQHHLEWPDEQMMSRFVRTVDPARRHELIIFYDESVADAGYTLAQIGDDGGVRPPYRAVAESLTARSLRAFTILAPDGKPSCIP
jgi:hypothetical protein